MTDKETREETCGKCRGQGVTTSHVERDGGGFTGSEWAELDDDFRDGYMAGHYDKRCTACNGTGKVTVEVHTECVVCGTTLTAVAREHSQHCCSEKCWNEDRAAWLEYNCTCGRCGFCLG